MSRQQAISGQRPLGIVNDVWMDARNGLHWTATLCFADDETDLLRMYDSGLLPECSLQHGISDAYKKHIIYPIEISIVHKGMRPGSTIYTGGDTNVYMRNTGYTTSRTMSSSLVPAAGDILIECANKVGFRGVKRVLTMCRLRPSRSCIRKTRVEFKNSSSYRKSCKSE